MCLIQRFFINKLGVDKFFYSRTYIFPVSNIKTQNVKQ